MVAAPTQEHGEMDSQNRAATSWEITTRTGLTVVVRTVTAADDPTLARFFHHVSQEDLWFRFFSARKEIGADQIHAMTHVDHRSAETYLAFVKGTEVPVAAAALVGDAEGRRAEVAISVHAEFKHYGLGWEMLAFVAGQAAGRGFETIESVESRDNHEAVELERNMGFAVRTHPEDPTLLLVSKDLTAAPRAAAG
jgi:GNAT superfamily N-acetyltransferase